MYESTYLKQYKKYKDIYLKLRDGRSDYDEVTSEDTEYDDIVEDEIDPDVDSDMDNQILSEELKKKKHVDIGITGKARGKLYQYSKFDSTDFADVHTPNHHKILKIDNVDDFDKFTHIYGVPKKQNMYINWDTVSHKYRGFYLAPGIPNRDDQVPYRGKTYNSWIKSDYKVTSEYVVIFEANDADILKGKIVKHPFKAKIIDSYVVDELDYTNVNEKEVNKILLIDSIKSFDKFTKKYGKVKRDKVEIDWERVKRRYKGLYLDKSVSKYRRYTLVYDERKYDSWWGDMMDSVVYLFV